MQRYEEQIVTQMLVVVPADEDDSDGYVREHTVRVVNDEDVLRAWEQFRREHRAVGPKDPNWTYLFGIRTLQRGRELDDMTAMRKGAHMVFPHLAIAQAKGAFDGDPKQFEAAFEEWIAQGTKGDAFQLGYMISALMVDCTPQMFARFTPQRMRGYAELPVPAILCKTFAAAVAFKLFFHGLGVCPHCANLFIKEHPRQACCSIACREAHRIARWRSRKKLEESTRKQRHGGKRGNKK
jgi:hypothetical protein